MSCAASLNETPSARPSERRRHVVYVTRNTEYHCRDRECVGVKNRNNGKWLIRHPALRGRLLGGIRGQEAVKGAPEAGFRLVFGKDAMVMTSRVLFKGRPEKGSIFSYTSLCWSGAIKA